MAKGKRRVKQVAASTDDNLSSSTSSLSSMATSLSSTDAKELLPTQHCEGENKACQEEVKDLKTDSATSSFNHNDSMRKLKEDYLRKLNVLEEQVNDLKKKQDVQSQLSTYRRKNDEGVKAMQDEIQKLKVQKVQLQCKLKLDSVQSRICKATLEKEILQLKKEGRKNKYEVHKLLAVNQRQKQVIQRKTEEAIMVSNRLKQLLELREASLNRKPGSNNGADGVEEIKQELEVTSQINQICTEYEQQLQLLMDEVEKVNQEAEVLKEENIRLLLQAKDLECREDPELKDLKEDMLRLNSLLKQLEIASAKPSLSDQSQASNLKESSHASPSIGSTATPSDTGTSGARKSRQIISPDEHKATKTCCSCTMRSLCKTTKCECRAAGDSCGISCGCSPSKCTNQENHAVRAENPSKFEASTADLISTETKTDNIVEATTLLQTESLLVSEPAPPRTRSIPESHPAAVADDHCGLKKMPLYDIANTLVKSFKGKHNQKKKGRN